MTCPNCYTELPDSAKMCYNCKKQIIPDESEDDTSKICPNCGISLPLTANMCYCCKFTFNNTGTMTPNNRSRFSTIERNGNQRVQSSGKGGKSSEDTRRTAMIICIIGSVLCGIAVFMPFMGINILGASNSVSLIDNVEYGIETLFWAGASILFCIPKRQKSGAGHIILGAVSLINCIYNTIRMTNGLEESGYEFRHLVQRQSGFYALFLGSVMIFASGIIMYVAHKNEK